MNIKKAIELIGRYLAEYLEKRFSGTLVFKFDCRDGGIGRLSLEVKKDLTKEIDD